jgi:hypothetical protein
MAIMIVIIAALGALLCGLLLLVREARRAPPGYEDDVGFHSGRTPGEAEEF